MDANSNSSVQNQFILPIDYSTKLSFLNPYYFDKNAYETHKVEISDKGFTIKYDINEKDLALKSSGKNNISNQENKTNEEELLKKEITMLEKSHTNTYKNNINISKTGTFDLDLNKRKTSKFSSSLKDSIIPKNNNKLLTNTDLIIEEDTHLPVITDKWFKYNIVENIDIPRFGHVSFIYEEELYILLGYNFNNVIPKTIYKLNLLNKKSNWTELQTTGDYPIVNDGSKLVLRKDKAYVFGGSITDNKCSSLVYELDIKEAKWTILTDFIYTLESERRGSLISNNSKTISNLNTKEISTNNQVQNLNLNKVESKTKTDFYTTTVYVTPYFSEQMTPEMKKFNAINSQNSHLQIRNHILFIHEKTNSLIVHGGLINNINLNKKTYTFSIENKKWSTLVEENNGKNTSEEQNYKYNHAGVLHNEKIYIFGGINENHQHTNTIFQLDLNVNTPLWVLLNVINNCYLENKSGLTANLYNNDILIFGGKCNPIQESNSLLIFDIMSNTLKYIHPTLLECFEEDLEIRKSKYL